MNRDEYPSIAGDIPGWLDLDEAWTLWDLAKAVPKNGTIVEIGSFLGKSTVCLGDGSKHGNKAIVFTIDHHKGSPEHLKMTDWPPGVPMNTFPQFRENIFRAELIDIVKPIIGNSQFEGTTFSETIDLLFIDGSHKHENVKQDFELWSSKLKGGGTLILHDTYYWPGPTRLLAEILVSELNNPAHPYWLFNMTSHKNMAILTRV